MRERKQKYQQNQIPNVLQAQIIESPEHLDKY
jgi:hypothetical protein